MTIAELARAFLFVSLLPFILTPALAQSKDQNKKSPQSTTELIAEAKGLIDQNENMDLAKQDIYAALTNEPKNVFALKQLARYDVADGLIGITNGSEGNGVYPVGVYKPGALESAEKTILDALQIDPNFAGGYQFLAHIYVAESKLPEAQYALEKAEKLDPDNPWLHNYWAELLVREGDWQGAADHCWLIIKNEKSEKRVLIRAARYLVDYFRNKKEYDKADALYIRIVELNPTSPMDLAGYSNFLRTDVGNFDKAIEYADKSLHVAGTQSGQAAMGMSLYGKWADISINHNNPIEAQKYFDIANKIIPDLNYVMIYEGCYATEKALVIALKKRGVSIDAPASSDGSTALMIASNLGRADAVQILLSLGADPNAKSRIGWTPLLGAADEGRVDVVKLLLEAGADKKQTLKGRDAEMMAQGHGKVELATIIHNYGTQSKSIGNP